MSEQRTPVFVYGTLKRGLGNHRLLEAAEYRGPAVTLAACWELFCCGAFPAVVPCRSPRQDGCRIAGELYGVTRLELAALDRLEGHPRFYARERIRLVDAAGETRGAWCYILGRWEVDDAPARWRPVTPNEEGIATWEKNIPAVAGDH